MALSSLQLEAFYALAQERSFTKAAARLHVTQSALSQRILNLEEDLGTTLVIRDRAGVQLTDVAWELLRFCQTKETLEGEFISKLKSRSSDDLRGVIRIAGFSSVMRSVILPALTPLLEKHPKLHLDFLARETADLPDLLKRGIVEFIVLDSHLEREELVRVELGQELNVLIEKKGYKGGEVYLDHDEHDPTTLKYLKLAKRKSAGIERRFMDDVYGLLDGARLGIGRAVIPQHLIRGSNDFKLVDPEVILKIPVVLHHFQQPYYSVLHQRVVEALKTQAGAILEGRIPKIAR